MNRMRGEGKTVIMISEELPELIGMSDRILIMKDGKITGEVAQAALKLLDVDVIGLDTIDRRFMTTIMEKFAGGPVGIDNLASALGEDRETLEDVVEPYLIQQGLVQRTVPPGLLRRSA